SKSSCSLPKKASKPILQTVPSAIRRSDRSRIGQDVAVHAGFKSSRPDLMGQETPQPLGRRAFFACFLLFFTTGIAVQNRRVLVIFFFSVRRNSLSQLPFSRFT